MNIQSDNIVIFMATLDSFCAKILCLQRFFLTSLYVTGFFVARLPTFVWIPILGHNKSKIFFFFGYMSIQHCMRLPVITLQIRNVISRFIHDYQLNELSRWWWELFTKKINFITILKIMITPNVYFDLLFIIDNTHLSSCITSCDV